jgi:predicted Zn-dependent protease
MTRTLHWVPLSWLLLSACGGGSLPDLFSSEVSQLVVEVDYQAGAAPYTEQSIWTIFSANVEQLFLNVPRGIVIPQALGAMERIDDIQRQSFDTEDLVSISRAYRDQTDTISRRSFHVLFLDGYLQQSGRTRTDVIGVSVEGTGIIAIFKPVLRQAGNPRFVEQSTLVHEFGHAVGLVNLGLPLTSSHHDSENGAHCTNRDCVMFHLHEGRADLMSFYQRYLRTRSPVLFGKECLDDAWTASR